VTTPAFVAGQIAQNAAVNAASATVTLAGVTSGNTIVVGIAWLFSASITSVKDGAGNNYTAAIGATNGGSSTNFGAVYYRTNVGAGSNAITVTMSTTVTDLSIIVEEITPVGSVVGTGDLESTSGTTFTSGTVAVSAGALIYGLGVSYAFAISSAGTGYTLRSNLATNPFVATEDATQSTSGNYAATWNCVSGGGLGFLVAFASPATFPGEDLGTLPALRIEADSSWSRPVTSDEWVQPGSTVEEVTAPWPATLDIGLSGFVTVSIDELGPLALDDTGVVIPCGIDATPLGVRATASDEIAVLTTSEADASWIAWGSADAPTTYTRATEDGVVLQPVDDPPQAPGVTAAPDVAAAVAGPGDELSSATAVTDEPWLATATEGPNLWSPLASADDLVRALAVEDVNVVAVGAPDLTSTVLAVSADELSVSAALSEETAVTAAPEVIVPWVYLLAADELGRVVALEDVGVGVQVGAESAAPSLLVVPTLDELVGRSLDEEAVRPFTSHRYDTLDTVAFYVKEDALPTFSLEDASSITVLWATFSGAPYGPHGEAESIPFARALEDVPGRVSFDVTYALARLSLAYEEGVFRSTAWVGGVRGNTVAMAQPAGATFRMPRVRGVTVRLNAEIGVTWPRYR
jgi:hypothetical protein